MKKFTSLFLALVMVCSLSVSVFAAGIDSAEQRILDAIYVVAGNLDSELGGIGFSGSGKVQRFLHELESYFTTIDVTEAAASEVIGGLNEAAAYMSINGVGNFIFEEDINGASTSRAVSSESYELYKTLFYAITGAFSPLESPLDGTLVFDVAENNDTLTLHLFTSEFVSIQKDNSTITTPSSSNETVITYTGVGTESYTITVPASLTPGESGDVSVSGTWATNRKLTVTAPSTVTLTNSINSSDTKTLAVTFDGIAKTGDNTVGVSETKTISVADISDALFGTWSGVISYTVSMGNAA